MAEGRTPMQSATRVFVTLRAPLRQASRALPARPAKRELEPVRRAQATAVAMALLGACFSLPAPAEPAAPAPAAPRVAAVPEREALRAALRLLW